MNKSNIKKLYLKVFFSAFFMFLIGMLPILIATKGKYMFLGDYNVQIVPFANYIAKMYEEGLPAFDWNTDLGIGFIGAYSFYGLASPFTFLSLLFPLKILPYGLTVINALKYGVAALSSFIFCREHVKKDNSAYLCGLLYAFSGIQLFNNVFHFSDIIALFPFLLLAFDKLIINKKSIGFAIMLGIMGLTNYYFLWGECVFLLIYFIINIVTKRYKINIKLFCKIAFETLLGLGLSMIILFPSFMSLIGNSRAGNLIFDSNLLSYDTSGTIWKIIQSLFMLPDMCNKGTLFSEYQLDVASVSLYIPLFTIIGISFAIKTNKKSWYSVLIYVCGLFAAIPLLNSTFSAFNNNYYARWFFMPMLIMIMMTGKYLDDIENIEIKKELKIITAILTPFVAYGIYLIFKNKIVMEIKTYFILTISLAIFSLLLLFTLRYKPSGKITFKNLNKIVSTICVVPFIAVSCLIVFQVDNGDYIQNSLDLQYNGGVPISIDDSDYFRVVTNGEDSDNSTLNFGYPSINTYLSTIPGNITDFWALAGRYRESYNTINFNDYPACSLLSVKYNVYFNKPLPGGVDINPEDVLYSQNGFKQYKVQNKFIIFENENYIPMGFTFDYYIDENNLKSYNESNEVIQDKYTQKREFPEIKNNEKLLLKAIALNDEQICKYKDILEPLPDSLKKDTSDEAYYIDCENRKASAGYVFSPDKNGFTSKIKLDRENLVFYSVPYNDGFIAYVDGEKTDIEKVFGGLCAVKVPEGDHTIRFEYVVPGLKAGKNITFASLLVLIVYSAVIIIKKLSLNIKQ